MLTDEEREQFKQRIAAARNEGLFTPIGFSEAIHMPGNNGGSNFGSTSSNPTDGTVYVISYDIPAIMRLLTPEEAAARGNRGGGGGVGAAGPGLVCFSRDCHVVPWRRSQRHAEWRVVGWRGVAALGGGNAIRR